MRSLTLGLALLMLSPIALAAADLEKDAKTTPMGPIGGPGIEALGCSLGSGTTALADGVSTSGSLTADTGAQCDFSFVPDGTNANAAKFVMTLTTSDFDLYVKKGSMPTTSSYDCRPYSGGTTSETCTIDITDSTTIFAMVRRFSGSGGFSLTASNIIRPPSCSLGSGVTSLSAGVAVTASLTTDAGANCKFSFTPSANADVVHVTMTPPASGLDPDLYVKVGSMPTTSSYDCRPYSGGATQENCDVLNDGVSAVFAMVYRFSGSGTFTIVATELVLPTLENGMPLAGTVQQGKMDLYKVILPAGSTALSVAIAGPDRGCPAVVPPFPLPVVSACAAVPTVPLPVPVPSPCDVGAPCPLPAAPNVRGDADLYVRALSSGGLPSTTKYDCRAWSYGTGDACVFNNVVSGYPPVPGVGTSTLPAQLRPALPGGKVFVGVNGYRGPADYNVVAVFA